MGRLTRDEARRMAANFAMLPEMLRGSSTLGSASIKFKGIVIVVGNSVRVMPQ
jgi:hypothetical protein